MKSRLNKKSRLEGKEKIRIGPKITIRRKTKNENQNKEKAKQITSRTQRKNRSRNLLKEGLKQSLSFENSLDSMIITFKRKRLWQ